jgi:hypothetical protein
MEFIDLILQPCAFSVVAVALWLLANRSDPWVRMPLGIYAGTYLLTTGIGGILIGCTKGEILEWMQWDINLNLLPDVNSLKYWALLFAPLIVPPTCILCLQNDSRFKPGIQKSVQVVNESLTSFALGGTFIAFVGYCIAMLVFHGQAGNILLWFSLQGDYLAMIWQRQAVGDTMGSAFFGIAYITLPTLSFCALYQYRRLRTSQWKMTFLVIAASTVLIDMELMQKSPALVFFVFIGIGLIELKTLQLRSLVYIFGGLIVAITLFQSLVSEQWGWLQSIQLLIFRMAHGFPCYVNVYPDVLPHTGIESGLHLIGLGEPARDCFDVFTCMFPNAPAGLNGALAAPAHMRAYSQAGLPYALVTLVIIGFMIKGIGAMHRRIAGPISFAFFLQSLLFLYNTSQTSLRESIISCYGIFWCAVGLLPLLVLQASRSEPFLQRDPKVRVSSQVRRFPGARSI